MSMSRAKSAYDSLVARLREVQLVSSINSLLSWDQETYLPSAGADYRAEQLAYLSGWAHRLATDDAMRGWLEEAEGADFAPHSAAAVNLREARRNYEREAKLPVKLVEDFARVSSQAHHAWMAAREKKDYATFAPFLQRLLQLSQEKAECWGYVEEPYDALLEGHEPGMRTSEVARLLGTLAKEQRALLAKIVALAPAAAEGFPWKEGTIFPLEKQAAFNREVAAAFGFAFDAGRLDTTAHPFCTALGPCDVRLTTRYDPADFTNSLYSVLHEAGHGLYEQGLPSEHFGLGAGQAVSLGIHESQSRLWENKVGRTECFWATWLPRAVEYFPELHGITPDQLARHVLPVRPSFIRVEADEVSYDLHIVLRFELERALLQGELPVEDLPQAWNERFRQLLGLQVPDDGLGCLQDIHWSMGAFGYFPTYSLGNLYSAQLFVAAEKAMPELPAQLARGEYVGLLDWLREKIHHQGCTWSASELIERATGSAPDAEYHLSYLRNKYPPPNRE